MMDRRYGLGSVYQGDRGWVASAELPPLDGRRRRKRFIRPTREAAVSALDAWLIDHPRPERESEGRAAHLDLARSLGTHTAQEWRAKVQAHGGRCHYCGRTWGTRLHKDHMMPISRGGSDSIDNLAPACSACNLSKGAMTAAEFRDWATLVGFFDQPRRPEQWDAAAYMKAPPLVRLRMLAERDRG